MKISKLRLLHFKRFTDLIIDLGDRPLPRLVLLIGANGCGKSSVFDAFEFSAQDRGSAPATDFSYYLKNNETGQIEFALEDGSSYKCVLQASKPYAVDRGTNLKHNSFYGRSAVRYLPRITRTNIGQTIDIEKNSDRPKYFIEPDNRFENDIDVLIKDVVDKIFSGINTSSAEQLDEIKAFLNRFNEALPRIFGEGDATSLRFVRFVPPSEGRPSKLFFRKGSSEINYDLLSSGEKEVVNILFNLFVRTPFYPDSIYFFDELDAHLHTALQFNLLREIVEHWIPPGCQLWTASHSLGFIRYARSSPDAAVIDFDDHDFDQPILLSPQKSMDVFDIAVPKDALEALFKDKIKIFCEGQNGAHYNALGLPDTLFLGDADKSSVFLRVAEHGEWGIIDRDYLTDTEVEKLRGKFPRLIVLHYYCFENYLYHPDNLRSLDPDFDPEAYIKKIVAEKNRLKDDIISKIRGDRKSYIFFTRNEYHIADSKLDTLFEMLGSDDLEVFYQVFSMKHRGDLSGLHNASAERLARTAWFKDKMGHLIAQSRPA
jgi:hypothetical protein